MTASVDRTIIARSLADRLPGVMKAAGGLGFYALVGSWIYSGFSDDLDEILVDFPEGLTALMGGNLVGGTGGYITSVMLNFIGPMMFIGLAAFWGAGAIAGEESAQTARLLFAQPVTRRQVLVDRAIVIAVALGLGVAVFVSGLAVGTAIFDDNGPAIGNLAAAGVQLALFAFAMGMVALAGGSATGSKSFGVAAGAGVGLLSYLVDAFAPLTAAEGLERFTPWYLYNGSEPIDNGADLGHISIQLVLALCFFAIGYRLVDQRDLERGGSALLGRIPALNSLATQRVSSVFARTLSARTGQVVAVGVGLGAMAIGMAFLFDSLGESFRDLDLPTSLEKALGGSSLATPVGWMNSQLLTIVAPLAVLWLVISMGLDAVAGERERRTLLLALSASSTRTRFFVEKFASMLVAIVAVSLMIAVGLFVGSALGGLDLTAGGIVGTALQLGCLCLFFGAVATAAGVVWSRRTALGASVGLAVASFLSQSLLSAVNGPGWLKRLSPWDYYIGNDPLSNGLSIGNLAMLLALAVLVTAIGAVAFQRADAA